MALQSSGQISLDNIQTEIGGSNPISINEYYGRATGLPSTGQISLQDFYGKAVPPLQYFYLKEAIVNPDFYGANTSSDLFGGGSPGSLGPTFNQGTVSVCDLYAAIGTADENDVGVSDVGVVYIFDADVTSSTYGTLLRTIENPNDNGGTRTDNFGRSVSICDNYLVVTASFEDTATLTDVGVVYVFNPATGALLHTIFNPDGVVASEYFGSSCAVTNNYIAIGAATYNNGTVVDEGKVYIFNPSTGSLIRSINNPKSISAHSGDYSFDYFGRVIALTDTHLVVNCSGYTDAGGQVGGFYIIDPSNGSVLNSVLNPNGSGSDSFAESLDISDNHVIIGSSRYPSNSLSGRVYIYDINTVDLVYTINNPNYDTTSSADYFGFSVSITNQFAIAGARNEYGIRQDTGASVTSSGVVYVIDLLDGSIIETIQNPSTSGGDSMSNDLFGTAARMHGDLDSLQIWVGAPQEDRPAISSDGSVYVFRFYNDVYRSRTVLYTGASAPNDVTGFGFDPDFVILKSLSLSTGYPSWTFDSVRGIDNGGLALNSSSSTTGFDVEAITDGISFTTTNSNINQVGINNVAWAWNAGDTSVTNTDGDINSTVRANPETGFSVVRWTSTGGATLRVGHGLGIVPEIVIQKRLGTYTWIANMTGLFDNFSYFFPSSNSVVTESSGTTYMSTTTTFPQFTNTSGLDVMAYCFASVPGVSKIGTYTGTGTVNTVRVVTGFEPSIIMIKGYNSGDRFLIYDNKRDTTNPITQVVELTTSNIYINNSGYGITIYQSGFYISGTATAINASRQYLYMAFA